MLFGLELGIEGQVTITFFRIRAKRVSFSCLAIKIANVHGEPVPPR